MRRLVTCCAALLALDCGALLAEPQLKEKTVGDWTAVENAAQYSDELSSREFGSWAWTYALSGREGVLGISRCGRYSVAFSLQADTEFKGPKSAGDDPDASGTRLIYGKVLPSESLMSPTLLWTGYEQYFFFDADKMIPAGKFLICPTNEEGRRCLTFSLRGFTAALKTVCPKR
jgi:hypothetical protein